ncbi:MAG: PAP/fibrillin family protein [Synechococcaceae cyanobacterium]|nr:PAP/fibrillin family protein [Synechococcaceae cyanobacterium]
MPNSSPSPRPAGQARAALLTLLRQQPRGAASRQDERVRQLCQHLERVQPADLAAPGALELLEGVWELRWSSSRQPYLAVGPWLENLQLLAPSQGRAMNLLRLPGPLAPLAGIAVEAAITVEEHAPAASLGQPQPAPATPCQRVAVRFRRGGWLGPALGNTRLQLLRGVQQPFPAWLDITVLDQELRVCRGNAGTLFTLLRRPDLRLADLLLPLTSAPAPESPAGPDPA